MLIILEQLFVLYIFLFLGWLFGKLKKEQASQTGILSFLIVNLFLPCKVFNTFSQNFTVTYITGSYTTIIISVSILLSLVGISLFLSRYLTKEPYERRVYRYSMTISNYGYMGYTLTEAVFGEQALTDLILYAIPFAIYTYTFGYAMLTGKDRSLKKLINPMTIAIALGMFFGLTGIPVPNMVKTVLSSSAACVGPVSMILTGVTLSAFSLRELVSNKTSYILVALRLVGIPFLVFAACKLLRFDSIIAPAVIMASMPCGLNTIVFPKLVGEDCKLGARLALLSHLFSILTIPVWLSMF